LFGMFWIARLGRRFYVRGAGGSIAMSAVAGMIVVIVLFAMLVLHHLTRGAAGNWTRARRRIQWPLRTQVPCFTSDKRRIRGAASTPVRWTGDAVRCVRGLSTALG